MHFVCACCGAFWKGLFLVLGSEVQPPGCASGLKLVLLRSKSSIGDAENKCVQQLFLNVIKLKCKQGTPLNTLHFKKPYYLNNSRSAAVLTLLAYNYAVIYRRYFDFCKINKVIR